jgi:hypothetical protein
MRCEQDDAKVDLTDKEHFRQSDWGIVHRLLETDAWHSTEGTVFDLDDRTGLRPRNSTVPVADMIKAVDV